MAESVCPSVGPPDLISDMVQPLDLVNSVNRPAVMNLEQQHRMPVDIVEDLPDHVDANGDTSPLENGRDTVAQVGDRTDARWFSRGTGAASGQHHGIPMPTSKDATHYKMSHRRRGKAYIFNHMNFDPVQQLRPRNGTDADRDNLRVCLRQLDFEVEVFDDLPVKEIDRILESASMEDHSDADCILVAVMSHGEQGILYGRDSPYKPDRLWSHFTADKCRTLAGKPKLFFVQACQGDRLDHGVRMAERTETDAGPSYKIPNHADFLIVYSTIPGFYSWRNTTAGSWFIQALVHVLQREANSSDLLSILTRVSRKVAFDFQSNTPNDGSMHEKKQIPCVSSMLTRDIVFTRK